MVLIGAVALLIIWLLTRIFDFLQPVLVPLAIAGIIAYLLEPLIKRLHQRGLKRGTAMLVVYIGFHSLFAVLIWLIVPPVISQSIKFVNTNELSGKFLSGVAQLLEPGHEKTTAGAAADTPKTTQPATTTPTTPPAPPADTNPGAPPAPATGETPPAANSSSPLNLGTLSKSVDTQLKNASANWNESLHLIAKKGTEWWNEHKTELTAKAGGWAISKLQGALGLVGYLIGIILVPLYLYYFLKESAAISSTWSDYLPLKQSQFKTEVVDTLNEINGYLISFFRGQMLVSMIDGILVGIFLTIIGLPYGLLIGVCVALLGLLPYIGSLICWIPAVVISFAHFSQTRVLPIDSKVLEVFKNNPSGPNSPIHLVNGEMVANAPNQLLLYVDGHPLLYEYVNTWGWFPHQIWVYPVIVTLIFIIVQKINSFFTTPRIVGDSVGLHPLTVIFSVLFWSLLIGGFLGALLAVPLTAAVKVLFRRYIWERRLQPQTVGGAAATATATVPEAPAKPAKPAK